MIHIQNFVVAALFGVMGAAAFWRPESLLAPLGMRAQTTNARNEVQAVYGGFGLAVAAILVAPQWVPSLAGGPAITVATALLGMAGGRAVGCVRERALPSEFGTRPGQ